MKLLREPDAAILDGHHDPVGGRADVVHSFAHALPGLWLRMAAMLNGAGALAFAARLLGAPVADLEREAAEGTIAAPANCCSCPISPASARRIDDPRARGVAFGLAEATSRADFIRAVMEGVAFTLADARDCLMQAGDALGQVGLIGGGARKRAVDADDRRGARSRNRPLSRRRDRPRLWARRGSRGSPRPGRARGRLPARRRSSTSTAPEPALAEAFALRREGLVGLYRAVKGEFAAPG